MHVFSKSGYRLNRTALEIKIAYSGCLVLLLGGIGSMLALGIGRIGLSPASIAAYYRGSDAEMSFPKEVWQLTEEAHFHLFSIPVVLLILTHLLFATGTRPRVRLFLSIACYLGAILEIACPFGVRYAGAGFAYPLLAGWALLTVGMLGAGLASLASMWTEPPDPTSAAAPPAHQHSRPAPESAP